MSSRPVTPPRFVAHRVADLQLRGVAGRRRARAYWPSPSSSAADPALLVLFGGDRSVFDEVDGTDSLGRGLCVLGGVVVVSASPRNGSHGSPMALDDAAGIVGWVADHARELGADPRQLVLAGEGSGATIVTAVARQARDNGWPRIVRQLLVEPDGEAAADALVRDVAPATVVTVTSGADRSLVDMASALRRSLPFSTRRRPRRPRSAGASND